MLQKPESGYTFLNGEPLNLIIFHQYQSYLENVKIILKEDKLLLHYFSDDVVEIKNISEELNKQIVEDKKIIVWEVSPFTGELLEKYEATL